MGPGGGCGDGGSWRLAAGVAWVMVMVVIMVLVIVMMILVTVFFVVVAVMVVTALFALLNLVELHLLTIHCLLH